MSKHQGVVGVYVRDDRVVASASDFRTEQYGGFTLAESQKRRVEAKLARAVLNEYCAPVVASSLDTYYCDLVVQKMPGQMEFIEIGHDDPVGDRQ